MGTYFLFIDESGNANPAASNTAAKPFVLGGIAIPADVWHAIDAEVAKIKAKYGIVGELKFSDFGKPTGVKGGLAHLNSTQRSSLRTEVCRVIASRNSVSIIAAIDTPAHYATAGQYGSSPDGLHTGGLKALSERFQYHLQDLSRGTGSNFTGVLVCDARNRRDDQSLREAFAYIKKPGIPYTSTYNLIVEGLFLADSQLSVGLQLADIVAGAIARHESHPKDPWYHLIKSRIRRSPSGTVDGFGIVRKF
ncbi:MAG TPA: DUF3800 domain-containing protein [Planctomycetota bacterium]|nr:DUF3800 domain-containing protein [Planctomycetota bacterium]